ncbi:MAG: hypothetical protein J5654_09615 [Victivallales bacterium]|nr:hypothetical protein [Victivallales bacterium]
MVKVFDGKLYDTETAEELASSRNGDRFCNRDYTCESLYRTRDGRYFLAGEGGPETKYARYCGYISWEAGTDIIPITEDDAREWIECNAESKYEEIFGECYEV